MSSCIPIALDDAALRAHDLELWRVDLDAAREPSAEAVADLDADERARLARFRQVGDRARFAGLRAVLRQRLGIRLGIASSAVPIRIDARGKPRLPGDALWFSLAHCGDHGLIALSATNPVGVDLEQARSYERLDALADLTLSESERALWTNTRPGDRRALFLRAWTAKEAVLKAAGTGLLTDPRSLTVLDEHGTLAVRGTTACIGFDPFGDVVRPLSVAVGYAAALAVLTSGMAADAEA